VASATEGVAQLLALSVKSDALRLPALGLLPSQALAVGHRRSISVRLAPLERFPEQARGVGQLEATVERFIPCRPADCDGVGLLCRFSLALALGVGHADDEETLTLVACADFLRRKESFRNSVTQAFQLASDFPITEVEMIGDVFQVM